MSNYAWLCDYTNYSVANTYGMAMQTEEFDGVERFWLYEKEKIGQISNEEQQILDNIRIPYLKFFDAWQNRELIKHLPIKLFKEPDINYSNLPQKEEIFFRITGGYLVMNEKLYNIISQFNLGKTHFSQVYIYDIQNKEQLSDVPYYFINIAETFEFLNSNHSKGIKASRYTPEESLRYIWGVEDDNIVLLEQVKNIKIDLWHDKNLHDSLFFSDRLVQALFDAGFNQKQLGLTRCVIK
ncbi:imm11 family protein [Alysiella filiformis]|uniref:Immunity MXAN-0049 protein domain-containing protein n=1 Tax=Alysiella filiformis DSM 16848 TaxID=1120981 RepID=A0A286EGV2_9NEIS|nr:hypothetical protein [Alysiella filiformis]QMT31798.1 hypothetical protein H3L97_02610 [Alysiella filiformis]UBQ55189.1 hypothetical protein JF568_06070 [Alysiella filiformis DSM 16848]SOD70049.1 hypothetical protein SAMN02746062_01946 [Alysiella filiformis DSM 16848]